MLDLWKNVFQKNQDGGLNGFFHSSCHLGFFERLFFHKICVLLTPNECKKRIEKCWMQIGSHQETGRTAVIGSKNFQAEYQKLFLLDSIPCPKATPNMETIQEETSKILYFTFYGFLRRFNAFIDVQIHKYPF
jgi:hypothetical protein